MKFPGDRRRWPELLFRAGKRYGLRILNYTVTSNRIHLPARDDGGRDVIPESVKLTAGRTGREYNRRKNRKGAFREDRYHATVVQKGIHLIRCPFYTDLNTVRAGVVKEPSERSFGGYSEIREPGDGMIDHRGLMELLNISSLENLKESHCKRIMESLKKTDYKRDDKWTKSIAIGDKQFEKIKEESGFRARGRKQVESNGVYRLREQQTLYGDADKSDVNPDNTFFRNIPV